MLRLEVREGSLASRHCEERSIAERRGNLVLPKQVSVILDCRAPFSATGRKQCSARNDVPESPLNLVEPLAEVLGLLELLQHPIHQIRAVQHLVADLLHQ